MKIRDYDKWMGDDYTPTERFAKKSNIKKMKKFDMNEDVKVDDTKRRPKKK